MLKFFKGASVYQIIVWAIIIGGAIFSMFPPEALFFKVGAKFVVQIMFSYLALALIFLMISDEKSMFVSFFCCAALCLFLRTGPTFFAPPQAGSSISVATFNLANSNDNFDSTLSMILNSGADLIALQEVTPDWANYIENNTYIQKRYPFDTALIRMDFFGMSILSKYKFLTIDTFQYEGIPNFIGMIHHDSLNENINFISSHTTPPVSIGAYKKIYAHLQVIGEKAVNMKGPVLVLGDYQVVPWSDEILALKQTGKLSDSRRDMPTTYFPHDHIFYSNALKCLDFQSISSQKTTHLGIIGKYQLNKETYVTGQIE